MTGRTQLGLRGIAILAGILAVLPNFLITNPAAAQTDTHVFEINNVQSITIPSVDDLINKPQSDPAPEAPTVDPNIAVLQDFLTQKNSPLAPYAANMLQYENWKLVLAISNGESTMCKHQMYNNCWGVGGAWNLKRYDSFMDGFSDVDQLLANKYIALGQDTPKEIVHKYVGSYSPTWVAAVSQTLNQIDQLPLAN